MRHDSTPATSQRSGALAGALVSAALCVVVFAGCGARGPAASEVKASAEQHLTAFVEFDAWARRVALGDPAFRNDRAFVEAAFAPLRDQVDVANAWIERKGTSARMLVMHAELAKPPDASWVPMRQEELGAIQVAYVALPPRGRPGTSGPERPCVLVAHEDAIDDGAVVRVIVAYLLAHD